MNGLTITGVFSTNLFVHETSTIDYKERLEGFRAMLIRDGYLEANELSLPVLEVLEHRFAVALNTSGDIEGLFREYGLKSRCER
jgi:hypothetical protein